MWFVEGNKGRRAVSVILE